MIIISNPTGTNEIAIIPREGVAKTLILTDDVTGEAYSSTPVFNLSGYYTITTIPAFELVDQRRYNLKILGESDETLYEDVLFCSTQNNRDYSIANGEFNYDSAPVETEPQFIILDN
jgi:hypothetical protein